MNHEALSMANHLLGAVLRSEVNAQYHWAELLVLDALARGAKGPEAEEYGPSPLQFFQDEQSMIDAIRNRHLAVFANTQPGQPLIEGVAHADIATFARMRHRDIAMAEDAIEDARR